MALKYKVHLPELAEPHDVVSRELHVTKNGAEEVASLSPGDTEFELLVEQDVDVTLFLIDVDDVGNHSESSNVLAFKATDTVPPLKPGDLVLDPVVEEV